MKKVISLASLAVMTANVLGMNVENCLSTNHINMRSISSSDEQVRPWTIKIMNMLMNKGKLNVLDAEGNTILIDAVRNAPIPIIKQLLNIKDDEGKPLVDVNAKDKDGNTALLIAAKDGDIGKMRLLLSKGADVGAQNNNKETALLIAVKSEDNKRIKLLIKYDALSKNDLNSFDDKYKTIREEVGEEHQVLVNAINSCGKSEKSKSKLKEALNNWKEVNAPVMGEGLTPLMYAAMNDKRSATEVLLTFEDINVNLRWKGDGGTALAMAASKGHDKIVDLLLDHRDIQINAADADGVTPLFYAVMKSQGSIVKKLIEHEAKVDCQDRLGNAPIMDTLGHGHIDILNELIKAGADLNLKNNYGRTPLMFLAAGTSVVNTDSKVISNGYILKMLEILLRQSNIDVNAQDNDGNTALIIAAGEGRIKVVNKLIECKKVKVDIVNNKDNNAIMTAVQNDRKNVVQELLKQEYFRKNINYKNKKGQSVLSIATVEGYTGLVDLLLKQKDDKGSLIVDINTLNMYGNTPLMTALYNNHLEIVNKLLNQDNIDVTLEDQFRQTSLMFSAHKGVYSITKKILDRIPTDLRKSCVNIKSSNQVTAMTAAVFNNNAKMVKLLLNYGADVNTKFEDETMLMFAARNGFTEIVKLLLDAGADVNIKNNAKETVLDIVKGLDFRDEIIQLLQKAKPEFPQLGLSNKEINNRFKKAVENKSAKDVDQLLHQYSI